MILMGMTVVDIIMITMTFSLSCLVRPTVLHVHTDTDIACWYVLLCYITI